MAQGLHWHQTGGGHGEHDSWRNAERKRALTPDHYVVTIIDLQPHRLFGVGNFDRSSIINNNLVLAQTETCAALPTIRAIHDGYEVYVE